jgi:two-component system sensor histidine kinase/response regulator
MDDYLAKPYNGDALSAMIARWLAPPGPARADGAAEVAPVLDPAKLAEVRSLMGPRFGVLLAMFATSARDRWEQALRAWAGKDSEALLDAVHRLKNTAGDIGAPRLRDAAATLENKLKRGAFPVEGIDALERACRDAVIEVEQLPDWKREP